MTKTKITPSLFIFLLLLALGCDSKKEQKYFEGEIKMIQTSGLYGELSKIYTTYSISENKLKREQKLGGINSLLNSYAGIIVDLKKDSIILYFSDGLSKKKIKHTLSIQDYKKQLPEITRRQGMPTTFDMTFKMLTKYNLIRHINDSIKIKEFNADYNLYNDSMRIIKQEVFDTKEIIIKRPLLALVFINIPEEINFPLRSDIKTTASDINTDSLLGDKAKDKWISGGIKILKKGIDLNLHNTTEVSEILHKIISDSEWLLSLAGFTEVSDLNIFLSSLPESNRGYDD